MVDPVERARRRTAKRIIEAGVFASTFSISFTLLDAIFFQDVYILNNE